MSANVWWLKLTDEQRWLLLWTMAQATSDEGERALLAEFPDADLTEVAKDFDAISRQLMPGKSSGMVASDDCT